MNRPVKIAVIQFPGSNTERETFLALERAGMKPVEFLWNNDYRLLNDCDGYIIVGGFSYEDRARAGIIASLDPVINIIRRQAGTGKPVLGICNGAQILVETGMVPGLKNHKLGMVLAQNKRTRSGQILGTGYYNNWSNLILSAPSNRSAFTCSFSQNEMIYIPFAHAEGRFIMDEALLNELIENDQIVFRYCDETGNTLPEFPINPNGSLYNIAALCNPRGNVMAIMPHPERTFYGDTIFKSMKTFILQKINTAYKNLNYQPPKYEIQKLHRLENNYREWFIDSIITDNEAVSVQNALDRLQIGAKVKKYAHWKISVTDNDFDSSLSKIDNSGELYNSNKERLIDFQKNSSAKYFLVKPKEDLLGRHKTELLKNHFAVNNLNKVESGIIWEIARGSAGADKSIRSALDTNIFFNPFSHDCYEI